jgi:phosphatidylglycerophosphatase A
MTTERIRIFTWYGAIATLLGLGTFSKMPGTLGTIAALIIFLFLGSVPIWLLASVIVIGTIASDKYARATGVTDPGEVVIDEVAGFLTSIFGLAPSFAIVGFFLFRIVDILKPFPVRNMEKLPGGIGIMADDICGGLVVNVILRTSYWLFFSGGLGVVSDFLGIAR